ncbi:hypothetical protein G6O67_007258 [Ophiocordyceps sinensis]|uniref:Uncharacterized protein n=1 Tax=Ophiocordyceps sinensis TaxID=72228 RepID=A0A8H4LTG2_9HYPO|nr:hypothetical protein G6O67_007258 [Ophiocordyceps sinensis]
MLAVCQSDNVWRVGRRRTRERRLGAGNSLAFPKHRQAAPSSAQKKLPLLREPTTSNLRDRDPKYKSYGPRSDSFRFRSRPGGNGTKKQALFEADGSSFLFALKKEDMGTRLTLVIE